MTITTPSATAPPTICGYNTGHHIYIDSSRGSLTTNPTMTMTFTGDDDDDDDHDDDLQS